MSRISVLFTGFVHNIFQVVKQRAAILAEARPMSDTHASADYRRKMVAIFTRRALIQALGIKS